jgi:hypothetical protein
MPPEPALGDRQLEPGAIFGRAAALLEQERPVDLLDVDAAVLDGLDGVGDLQQLARGGFRISEQSIGAATSTPRTRPVKFAEWGRLSSGR